MHKQYCQSQSYSNTTVLQCMQHSDLILPYNIQFRKIESISIPMDFYTPLFPSDLRSDIILSHIKNSRDIVDVYESQINWVSVIFPTL